MKKVRIYIVTYELDFIHINYCKLCLKKHKQIAAIFFFQVCWFMFLAEACLAFLCLN